MLLCLACLSFDAGLFGCAATCLAYTINVYALSCPGEFYFDRHSLNHISNSTIIKIPNVATLKADQVNVRLHAGISCLAFRQIQFLDQALFRQNLKCFVDCGKTDSWMNLPDFIEDSLRARR
jgi:hypothetical protein